MIRRILAAALAAVVLAAVAVGLVLTSSLARRDGSARLAGLEAPVRVELDGRAIARIRAASLGDAFRAQGFVHAQERFFQMDLTRRRMAGELAALVGAAALPLDRERRVFQFRARAQALEKTLPGEQLAWLGAYAEGVNAGLADLGSRPPEYWLLRARPEPWTVEDSLLVVLAFYTMLSNNEAYERDQGVMHAVLPPSVYEFLTPSTSRFDRPLGAAASDPTGGYVPAPIPPTGDVDIREPAPGKRLVDPPLNGAASNQWAVAAERSVDGGAIVANDPHLELRLPNVFHRSELYWGGRVARGVGIPGVPGILIGATEHVAWGVTVSYADQSDFVVVDVDPADPGRYLVPGGSEPFRVERESIEVRGRGERDALDVRLTRWGPVVDEDWLGRPRVLRATWLDATGADIGVLRLMLADTAHEGLDVLRSWAGPSLCWMLADTSGEIAWIVNGPLPRRAGFDGSVPSSWADGARAWIGLVEPPALARPEDAALFSANNRVLPAAAAAELGRMWIRPLRAKRIADLLGKKPRFTEADFLAMQLDTRAEAYDAVRDVALGVLDATGTDAELAAVRDSIAAWNGRADADEAGFRLLHVYYLALLERVLAPMLAEVRDADPDFVYRWPLADEPLRRVLEERPPHLLPAGYADWDEFLRDVLADAVATLASAPLRLGPNAPWGEANRLDVAHPFAGVPFLDPLLRLPAVPQPGSMVSVRVAESGRSAVIRLVVSPSRPEDGILEMVGGQSGHFLSPSFRDQQADWAAGAPAPFLAGETAAEFTLAP